MFASLIHIAIFLPIRSQTESQTWTNAARLRRRTGFFSMVSQGT
jgi:hypothetical protein